MKDDLVDAYTVVSFAGHKEVTKTVNYTSSPEWKSEVNLEVRVCCAIHVCDCSILHTSTLCYDTEHLMIEIGK